jgi:transposase-like protein
MRFVVRYDKPAAGPIRIRQSAYLNNPVEEDHRAIKRRVRPMMDFKSMSSARAVLGGIKWLM